MFPNSTLLSMPNQSTSSVHHSFEYHFNLSSIPSTVANPLHQLSNGLSSSSMPTANTTSIPTTL